jgi:hypothetical protein
MRSKANPEQKSSRKSAFASLRISFGRGRNPPPGSITLFDYSCAWTRENDKKSQRLSRSDGNEKKVGEGEKQGKLWYSRYRNARVIMFPS